MQRLSKEQADWLIEKLRNQSFDLYGIHPNSREASKGFSYDAVEKIINQCTEKEFPEINMKWRSDNGADSKEHWVYCHLLGGDRFNILLEATMSTYFNKELFEEFTDGCVAITKWLEEQE